MVVKTKESFEKTGQNINTDNCISFDYHNRINTHIIVNMSLVFVLL